MQHHEDTLAAFVAAVQERDEVLGVVVGGSAARGTERPDSDVDVYLAVEEEEFARSRALDQLSYTEHDIATYAGGYVDVKLISPHWLATAPAHADQPTRASLTGAKVAWSRFPDLQNNLDQISSPPDNDWWQRQTESFTAQFRLYGGYFLPQGVAHGNVLLTHWAAAGFVTAIGRALLADARVLFAGPKYLRRALQDLPHIPEPLIVSCEEFLTRPDPAQAIDIMTTTENLLGSALPAERTLGRFIADVELAWLWSAPSQAQTNPQRGRAHGNR